jgi:hypothetical protein
VGSVAAAASTASARTSLPRQPFPKVAGGLLPGIDWTTAHSQNPAQGCGVMSKIRNGKFVPTFGKPGTPFVCFQAEPLPARPQSKPTLK